MSGISFPPKRSDGIIITSGSGSVPVNATFDSVEVTGDTISVADLTYQFPVVDGDSTDILRNGGTDSLTWVDRNGTFLPGIIQDFDGNTKIEVEQTPNDNTVRLTCNNKEVQTITETETTIINNIDVSDSSVLKLLSTPFNYSGLSAPVHLTYNSFIYYVSGTDLIISEISSPITVGVILSTTTIGFINPTKIYINGEYLYVTESSVSDSWIINIHDKAVPFVVGSLPYNNLEDFAFQGNMVYTAPDFLLSPVNNFASNSVGAVGITNNIGGSAKDTNGNIYTYGLFGNNVGSTMTFGTTIITPSNLQDLYVAKHDSNGIFQWVAQSTSSTAVLNIGSIDINSNNELFISVAHPGAGSSLQFGALPITTVATQELMIAELNIETGAWISSIQATVGTSDIDPGNIVSDDSGNTYFVGDMGIGTTTVGFLPLLTAVGSTEVLVIKMIASGFFDWSVKSSSGGTTESNASISGNDLYISGQFTTSITFGALPTINSTSNDIYILKIDASTGTFTWLSQSTSVNPCVPIVSSSIINSSGELIICGNYTGGAITFGVTPTLAAAINSNIFVVKIDDTGTFIWSNNGVSTGNSTIAGGISLLLNEDVIISGHFDNNITFGLTPSLTAVGNDIFITKLNNGGTTWDWSSQIGDTGNELIISHVSDNIDSIYLFGLFTSVSLVLGRSTLVSGVASGYPFFTKIYVEDLSSRVNVSSLVDPESPVLLNSVNIAGSPSVSNLIVRGSYLYVFIYMANEQAVLSYDISNTLVSPVFLNKLVINTEVSSTYKYQFCNILNNILYASSSEGPISINIHDPRNMSINFVNYTNDVSHAQFLGKFGYMMSTTDSLLRIFNLETMTYNTTSFALNSPISFSIYRNYIYVNELPTSTLNVYDLATVFVQQLHIGSLKTNEMFIDGNVQIAKKLNVLGGINVRSGLVSQADSGIQGDLISSGTQLIIACKKRQSVRSIIANTTLGNDYALNIQNAGLVTLTLPLLSGIVGSIKYLLIKQSTGVNNVDIAASGTDLIVSGATEVTTFTWTGVANDNIKVYNTGTKWIVI
jgi:hypothetical protein